MKANSNLAVLDVFARLGSGFDVVSGGELARVLAAGGDPRKVVFSGVGKTDDELRQALELGYSELQRRVRQRTRASAARLPHAPARPAPVSMRVNPDVDPQTHPTSPPG